MALSSSISSIYIRKQGGSGWKYTFTVKDAESSLGMVFFNSAYDEAIDGSLRTNIRGFRLKASLSWDKVHSSTVSGSGGASGNEISDFLDDLRTALATTTDDYVEISFDDSTYHSVIPDTLSYTTAYRNQVGRGNASFNFIGQEILTTIPTSLEAPSV